MTANTDTQRTQRPPATELAELRAYESRYAGDALGVVRWLASGEYLTDEMAAAKALLAK